MIQLIALQTSWTSEPDVICVVKDSRYTLEEVLNLKEKNYLGNHIWYRLLETGKSIHSSSLFAIAPAEKDEEEKSSESMGELDKQELGRRTENSVPHSHHA